MLNNKIKIRFEKKFIRSAGCWEWTAAKNHRGYGQFALARKSAIASRVSFMIYRGDIPNGMHVLHKCDNPACVCPDHLFLGTPLDNMLDRDAKGRREAPKGVKNGMCKLSEENVIAIRSDGRKLREIATDYGIHLSHVWKIKKGGGWAHV